ncbi:MAG: acyl-CoA thioesterase [Candidatus Marsarchaeota archaeon]|nr:acyl-CoA thioesterase [Candidatus Marsarchaeota archaeon]
MMKKSFTFKDRVRIYDTDAQGVVHYAGYYRFFTDGTENLLKNLLGKGYPLKGNTWLVVVESKAKYMRPSRMGDLLSVRIDPELISEKAIRFNFNIYNGAKHICTGYIIQVSIDKNRWVAVDLPREIRRKLDRA